MRQTEANGEVRRLVKDYERLPEARIGLHFVAFAGLTCGRSIGLVP